VVPTDSKEGQQINDMLFGTSDRHPQLTLASYQLSFGCILHPTASKSFFHFPPNTSVHINGGCEWLTLAWFVGVRKHPTVHIFALAFTGNL
jgi:hypothetical protein